VTLKRGLGITQGHRKIIPFNPALMTSFNVP